MSTRHLVDPELHSLIDSFPKFELNAEVLPTLRAMAKQMETISDHEALGVQRTEILVPGVNNEPEVRCLLYRPASLRNTVPAYLQFHGGGMVLNRADSGDERNSMTASKLGIVVLSVDYRLAPEHPFPAALNDGMAALKYLFENAATLGVDASRIAVGGESAGGGIAASICQAAVRSGYPKIAFQHLVYPMLDDRTTAPDARLDPLLGEFIWTPQHNRFGWSAYIGQADPVHAVPARADSLANQPPTWISTGELDLFLDEDIAYARRLMKAGVTTELQVYPGAIHGFTLQADASLTQRFERDYLTSLARGLNIQGETSHGN